MEKEHRPNACNLCLRQTWLLTIKNLKLQIRNKAALANQILIGVVFLILLRGMEYTSDISAGATESYIDTRTPKVRPAGNKVPRCTVGVDSPLELCYSFVYAPDTTETRAIVAEVASISGLLGNDVPFGYKGFADAAAQDAFLLANPNTSAVGVVFNNLPLPATPLVPISYTLQVNNTIACESLGSIGCSFPELQLQAPMQFALDSAFLRVYGTSLSDAPIEGGFSNFPHLDLRKQSLFHVLI